MPFWSKKKQAQRPPKEAASEQPTVVIMQSECLGMTVIE